MIIVVLIGPWSVIGLIIVVVSVAWSAIVMIIVVMVSHSDDKSGHGQS